MNNPVLRATLAVATKDAPPVDYYRRHGFTLPELLVVISVIAILAGLLLPVLKNSRHKAYAAVCQGNLKQIGSAVMMYAADFNGWLPHAGSANFTLDSVNKTWKELTAGYLNKDITIYNCEHGVFNCPEQKNQTCGNSAYGDKGFYGGYGWNYVYLGFRNILVDGCPPWVNCTGLADPSNTINLGDTSDYYINSDISYRVFHIYSWAFCGENALSESYRHSGGGNYLWCDGHVAWKLNDDVWANRGWYQPKK